MKNRASYFVIFLTISETKNTILLIVGCTTKAKLPENRVIDEALLQFLSIFCAVMVKKISNGSHCKAGSTGMEAHDGTPTRPYFYTIIYEKYNI